MIKNCVEEDACGLNLQLPVIHSNGNSCDKLRKQYETMYNLACAVVTHMEDEVEFHQRDYYPDGDEAWHRARKEWQETYAAAIRVRNHAYTLYVNLSLHRT